MHSKPLLIPLAMLALGGFMPGPALAHNQSTPKADNRWFISAMPSYPFSTGSSGFGGWGGFLSVAKPLNEYFALELGYQQYHVKQDGSLVNQKLGSLNGLVYIERGRWNPYVSAGLGYDRLDYETGKVRATDHTGDGAFASVGMGIIRGIAPFFRIRADLRYNRTFNDFAPSGHPLGNLVFSLGVSIPLELPHNTPDPGSLPGSRAGISDRGRKGKGNYRTPIPANPRSHANAGQDHSLDRDNDEETGRDQASRHEINAVAKPAPTAHSATNTAAQARPPGTPFALPTLHFAFDSSMLSARGKQELAAAARRLEKRPGFPVRVTGYTDSVGDRTYNLRLSRTRAGSVKAYLVSLGVDKGRLKTKGYGKADPVAPNRLNDRDNPAGRARNRRVELHKLNRGKE